MLTSGARLLADLDVDVRPDAPIGAESWFGVGGRADLLVSPRSVDALATIIKRCRRSRTPVRILGAGANLLVADEGVGGVVLKLDAEAMCEVRYNTDGPITHLHAMAGADLPRTLMDTARRGLRGLHHLAGIPATIGGATRMNAGGRYGCIADTITSVTVIDRTGSLVVRPRAEIPFDYRTCGLDDPVIVSVTIALEHGDPVAIRDEVKQIFAYKKSTQPLADHSAGCTFRNAFDPASEQYVSAGRLIDEAGLKGLRIGGAEVSQQHANFIVTHPGATARDVQRLIDAIAEKVFARTGLTLVRELVVWDRGDAGPPGEHDGGPAGGDADPGAAPRGVLDLDPPGTP
jgi:UDP-N-acetylmuramate dehydrogenase